MRYATVFASLGLCACASSGTHNSGSQAPLEQTVTSSSAALFVRSAGGGEGSDTLIVLHGGWGLSHEYLVSLEALASPDLRVVNFDQRACGRSTGSIDANVVAAQIGDLEAIRKTFGNDRVHIAGHSAGGFVAWSYALAHPEHTKSLMLIDSVPPTAKQLNAGLERFNGRAAELAKAGTITPAGPEADGTTGLLSVLPVYFVDTAHPASKSLNNARFDNKVFDQVYAVLGDYDQQPQLAQIAVPTLVFQATIPFGEMGHLVADALPKDQVTTIVLESCGHLPFVECPDQFFGPASTFLAKHR